MQIDALALLLRIFVEKNEKIDSMKRFDTNLWFRQHESTLVNDLGKKKTWNFEQNVSDINILPIHLKFFYILFESLFKMTKSRIKAEKIRLLLSTFGYFHEAISF